MNKAVLFVGLVLAGLLAVPTAAAQGDAEAGRMKAETCFGCHGVANYVNAYPTYRVPKIGGQHAEQIVTALQAYRSGERQHPTMTAHAEALSEQDMQDIGAYFATLAAGKADRRSRGDRSAGQEKAAVCATCHGPEGRSPNPAFPVLAGQYADYLVQSMRDYQRGVRTNAIMVGQAAALSEQDIRDLAAWFASQSEGLSVAEPKNR